jgi:hypothetical protein
MHGWTTPGYSPFWPTRLLTRQSCRQATELLGFRAMFRTLEDAGCSAGVGLRFRLGNGLRAVVMLGLSSGSSGVKGRDPRVGESGEAEYHTNRAASRGPDLRPPLGLSLAAGSRVAV